VIGALALSVCLLADAPPPVPWAYTGTSSVAALPARPIEQLVERRRFEKLDHLVTRVGFSWLSRGDLRVNPGVSADVAWYPEETLGLDLISTTLYFSTLSETALRIRKERGLLPDSQKPVLRLMTGGRWAFAYGKLLVEDAGAVVHLDASLGAHLGLLITDQAPNPGMDLGLAVQAVIAGRWLLWADLSFLLSYESRTESSISSGPHGTLGFGATW
jgi:hypothetical protein